MCIRDSIHILNDFKLEIRKVYSLGSCTTEWLLKTFTKPLNNVVYVSANPWVRLVFKNSKFFKLIDDVSSKFWDSKLGTVKPEYVNLTAIKYLIRGENVIVHYLQPHPPFIIKTWLRDNESTRYLAGSKIYEIASICREAGREFKRAYVENLKHVLKYVKKLVQTGLRLGYEIAITSDHSELMGVYAPHILFKILFRKNIIRFLKRWIPYFIGCRKVYGHPCGWLSKELYEVPWVEINVL